MDLVKKASLKLESCSATRDHVTILGRSHDGSQTVHFPTKKSKEYSLSSVVFYLLNSEKTLTEYVTLCKKNNVSPVSYVDRASIQSDICHHSVKMISGFFVQPVYSRPAEKNRPYEIISPERSKNVIVVSSGVSSRIHINNIEGLLCKGVLDPVPFNPLSPDSREICVAGTSYKVCSNVCNFQEEDWKCVRAVFMDHMGTREQVEILPKVPSGCDVFSLSDEKFKSVQILLRNETVRNHGEILKTLKR